MTWKVIAGLAVGAIIGYGLSLISAKIGST
jgi:hypothetical protein